MTDPVEKVQKALDELHYDGRIIHSDATIFTVEDASKAIGVTPGEILKSLIFMVDGQPWLVLMSGPNKAHSGKIKRLSQGHHVTMASPDYVLKISASGSAACRPSATRRRFPRCWTRICGITPSSGPGRHRSRLLSRGAGNTAQIHPGAESGRQKRAAPSGLIFRPPLSSWR